MICPKCSSDLIEEAKEMAAILLVILFLLPTNLFAGEWIIETSPTDYHPSRLKVETGDKITWINKDMVVHEMDFDGNPSDSGEENLYLFLPIGKKISTIITKPGIYQYKCTWHGMFGFIEVKPGKE